MCKTAPDHMANRIVKEHAAMKGSVCSTVKDVYGASNQMPKTRMGIFHLLKEAIRKDDLLKKYQMPFVIAAETAGEIQCLMELLKDENIQLTIVDGFEFGDAIEELKEKKVGIIFGNFSNLSQISKHEIDLSDFDTSDLICNTKHLGWLDRHHFYYILGIDSCTIFLSKEQRSKK